MRSKTIILIALALGCGLVASIGISQVLKNQQTGPVEETAPVLVAMVDIKADETLTELNLKQEQWPKEKIPPGAITEIKEITGKRLRAAVYQGEPVLDKKLSQGEESASKDIPPGYRLYTTPADNTSAAGGLLHPGDRVDMVLYLNRTGNPMDAGAKTILQDVRVFAVNDVVRTNDMKGTDSIQAKTVTLLLKPSDAEKATLASKVGTITLIVRAPDDKDSSPMSGGTTMASLLTISKNDRDAEEMEKPVNGNIRQASLAATLEQYRSTVETAPNAAPQPVEDTTYKMQIIKGTELSVAEFRRSEEDPTRWSNGSYSVVLPADQKDSAVAPTTQPLTDSGKLPANQKDNGSGKDTSKPATSNPATNPAINPLAKTPGHA